MTPTPPPTDPKELDRYVLDLVMRRAPEFDRYDVAEIEYVRTSRSAATMGAVEFPNPEVIFFQVSGEFTIPAGRVPRSPRSRGQPPKAMAVQLLSGCIDAQTGQGLDGGCGGPKVDMSGLGDVRRLPQPGR
jgi:hypothetical protein